MAKTIEFQGVTHELDVCHKCGRRIWRNPIDFLFDLVSRKVMMRRLVCNGCFRSM